MLQRKERAEECFKIEQKQLQRSSYNFQNFNDNYEKFKRQFNDINSTSNNAVKRQKTIENVDKMLLEEQFNREKENIKMVNEMSFNKPQRSNSLTNINNSSNNNNNNINNNNSNNINSNSRSIINTKVIVNNQYQSQQLQYPFMQSTKPASQHLQPQLTAIKTNVVTQVSEFNELVEQLHTQERLAKAKERFVQELNNTINQMHKEQEQGLMQIREKIEKVEEMQRLIKSIATQAEIEVVQFHEQIENHINKKHEVLSTMQVEEKKYDFLKKSTQQSDFVIQDLQYQSQSLQDQIEQITQENEDLEKKVNQTHLQTEFYNNHNKQQQMQMEQLLQTKRELNNCLQEKKGNIRVYSRIRPFLPSDSEENQQVGSIMQVINETNMVLEVPQQYLKSDNNAREYRFNFDHIFNQRATQQDIFNELSQLIQSLIDGFNVCIFAYGQTGSGKTYTMEGLNTDTEKGILQRSVELILSQVEFLKQYGWIYKIYISFQEIYMEQHRDLITNFKLGDKLSELTFAVVNTIDDFIPLQSRAKENRKVGSTMCNDYSSRSHCIFQLKLIGENSKLQKSIDTTLNLIDLAGSERISISQAEGQVLEETKFINKSLTSLGDVITAMINKEKHIPFRNSKLTYVLNPFLGENSKVLMLLNLSPAVTNFHQSLCSLRFGDKVSCVKLNKKQGIIKK